MKPRTNHPGTSLQNNSIMIDLAILYQLACLDDRVCQVLQGLAPSQGCQEGSKFLRKYGDFAKNGPFCEQKCHLDEEHGRPGGTNCDILAQQLESCRLSTTLLLGHVVLQGLSSKYWLGGRNFSKIEENRLLGRCKFLNAQDFRARFLPLRGLGAILGTPGWNCSVD